ncbi:MAG: glycosyltransferase family 2 protein [Rhodospirillales bacterium]|jgi:glycosyltransferase involved in cell wall biosynthesis|nr:glycosyltransferase family 2 protein [Rhodospirillales bacterium]
MPSEVQGSNTAAARPRVAVVIPCYREVDHIGAVISGIGEGVARIIVVDDACPDHTGDHVRAQCADPRVEVIVHERNTGVGGATLTGYRRALETGADIVVKLDGDGQMDPALIPALIEPIAEGEADYAKGNRFHQLDHITQMPALRIAGNLVLSFACKLSSGYWNIFDPTNGYTAIHAKVAERLPFGKISKGYFFESDMLFRLNLLRAVVADVPMHARYGDERSGLRISRALFEFTAKHWINTAKRILYSYFLRDFNAASVELVLGMVLFGFGVVFGALKWYESSTSGVVTTAGTVFIAALPIILGSQMLIAFLDFDTRNIPAAPIHRRL